jgi:plasmid stabilization system protein ParE
MTPYDTYRVYQIERAKSLAEIQRANEQAARVAIAVSSAFRGIAQAVRRGRPARARLPRPA